MAKKYWVVLLPEEPRVARLVFENGHWYLVLGSERVPVSLEAKPSSSLEELPEPDYDKFLSWCVKSATKRTCNEYVRYLRRFPWPLRRERLYEMELTKWHILALRNYLNYLREQGFDVASWKELRALRIPSSGEDRYIPPVDVVRDTLPRLIPRYRLIYYIILYSALRLEHTLRLLREWGGLRSRIEDLPGSCVRIALPASWSDDNKRAFYAYMPSWLYRVVDSLEDYKVPRRDSVTKHAKSKGAPAPKYIRKFALHYIAMILGPQAAAHIGGHDPGAQLLQIPSAIRTKVTEKSYISVEELVRYEYHRYASWAEANVAPPQLFQASS